VWQGQWQIPLPANESRSWPIAYGWPPASTRDQPHPLLRQLTGATSHRAGSMITALTSVCAARHKRDLMGGLSALTALVCCAQPFEDEKLLSAFARAAMKALNGTSSSVATDHPGSATAWPPFHDKQPQGRPPAQITTVRQSLPALRALAFLTELPSYVTNGWESVQRRCRARDHHAPSELIPGRRPAPAESASRMRRLANRWRAMGLNLCGGLIWGDARLPWAPADSGPACCWAWSLPSASRHARMRPSQTAFGHAVRSMNAWPVGRGAEPSTNADFLPRYTSGITAHPPARADPGARRGTTPALGCLWR